MWVKSAVYFEPAGYEMAERVVEGIRRVLADEGITSYTIMTEEDPAKIFHGLEMYKTAKEGER